MAARVFSTLQVDGGHVLAPGDRPVFMLGVDRDNLIRLSPRRETTLDDLHHLLGIDELWVRVALCNLQGDDSGFNGFYHVVGLPSSAAPHFLLHRIYGHANLNPNLITLLITCGYSAGKYTINDLDCPDDVCKIG